MASELISTAYFINPSYLYVCICIPLSLLGNGSVNTFPRQRIYETIEEMRSKASDNDILVQLLCFWALSPVPGGNKYRNLTLQVGGLKIKDNKICS
jgi:hypothetical protein